MNADAIRAAHKAAHELWFEARRLGAPAKAPGKYPRRRRSSTIDEVSQ